MNYLGYGSRPRTKRPKWKCQYLKMHAEKAIDIIYLEVSGGKGGDKKLRTTRK